MTSHKKYVPLLSLMILSSSMTVGSDNYSKMELASIAAALTAVAAATGAIWYACQPYSSEELLRKTEAIEAKFYELQASFNFPTASSDFHRASDMADEVERMGNKEEAAHYFISSLDESALYKYTGISGIVDGTFHAACTQLVDETCCLASKFPKTIQNEKDSEIKCCLQEGVSDLEAIQYGCLFLDKLFKTHKTYFELHDLTKKLSLQYAQELRALTYSNEHVRSFYSLKRVNQLAADLKKLQALLFDGASRRYPNLRSEAEYLSYDLNCICNNMLNDPRYALDLYNEQLEEQLRLERLRNQMLRNQMLRHNQMLRDQMYYSYQEPATHVHVDIQYTTPTAPAKNTKQQETPATSTPSSETKTDKAATLETSTTSIFDYSHGAADL